MNGQTLSDLPMMRDTPAPRYTIVETQRGEDFDSGSYELLCDGRVVASGSGPELKFALADRAVRGFGTVIGLQTRSGTRAAFKIRTPQERAAGVPAIVWRSDRERRNEG